MMSSPCDCGNLSQLDEVKSRIEEKWGTLDTIVSNVGDGRSVSDALPEKIVGRKLGKKILKLL